MMSTMNTGPRPPRSSRIVCVASALLVVAVSAGAQPSPPATSQGATPKPRPIVVAPQRSEPPAQKASSPVAKAVAAGTKPPKGAPIPLGLCSGD